MKEQFDLFKNPDELNKNPFEPTDLDVEEASIVNNSIDFDEDDVKKITSHVKKAFDEEEQNEENNQELPTAPLKKEPMKVFLRIRPFTLKEINAKENQGCIKSKNEELVELCAPSDSFTFKSSIRGLSDQSHEFSFTQVFQQNTQQKEFFDGTMLPFVKDILDGQNGLVFTYGVTNSGKTYTIQGTPKDGGILPRALDVIFNSISQKLYTRANLKPKHCHDIIRLNYDEEAREDIMRNAIFHANDKENIDLSVFKLLNSTTKTNISIASSNSTLQDISIIQKSGSLNHIDTADIVEEIKQRIADSTTINVEPQGDVKFGMWVSFLEIYNELMYDLLDLTPIGKGKKRPTLKLGDDKVGNPYVKGLTEVFVTSSDEAYKVLRLGQRNRHMAATKLNQMSSRSHCIFTIKLLKIVDVDEPHVARISRLSIVDLAGSERYCKTNAGGELLKEASNINCSIMTLGKCISTLRYNQLHPNHPTIVPFRESKLTRLFQSFFLGKGKASMIVNVSQCASLFDETYHVMKFSAVAKQIKMKAERATELWKEPPLPKVPATPSYKRPPLCIVTPATVSKKRTLEDPTAFKYDELTAIVAELRDKIKNERHEKSVLEKTIRKEVSMEMNELIVEIENSHSAQMMEQKQNLEETMENRLDLLTKTVNKQRKRKKTDDDYDDSYVSSVLLHAEKIKVKERDENILTLRARLTELEAEHDFFKKSRTPENHSKLIEELKSNLEEAKETLSMQNDGIKHMQQMLQDKDDEIDKLQEALEDDEQTREQDKSVEELQQLLESTIKELEIARVKLDNRDKRIKELENITEVQAAENAELVKLASHHEEWYKLTKEKNELLRKEKEEDSAKLNEIESHITKLTTETEEISTKLKNSEENFKIIQFENDELSIKVEKYKSLCKEHQTVLSENESIIEQLNEQVKSMKDELRAVMNTVDTNEACKEKQVDEVIKLKETVDSAEDKMKEYSEKVIRLEKQLHCYEVLSDLKQPIENKNYDVVKQFTTPVKKQNSPARSPFSPACKVNYTNTIKKLEKLLDESSKALEKKTNLVVTKTNRIQQLESKLSAFEKKHGVNELVAEKEALKEEVTALQEQYSQAKNNENVLLFKFENQEENSAALEQEVSVWMKKYEEAEICLGELKNDVKQRDCDIQKQLLLLDEKTSQISELKKNASNLHNRSLQIEEKLYSTEGQLDKCKHEVDALNVRNEEVTATLKNKTAEVEQQCVAFAELKRCAEEKDDIIQNLTEQQKGITEKSANLVKQVEELEDYRNSARISVEEAADKYEARYRNLSELNDNLQEEIVALKTSLRGMQKQVAQVEDNLKKVTKEKETFENMNAKYKEEITNLKSSIAEQSEKINNLELASQQLMVKESKMNDQLQLLERQVQEKEVEAKKSKDELVDVKAKLESVEKQATEKEQKILILKRQLEFSENEKNAHFKTIGRLEQERTESHAIIDGFKKVSTQKEEHTKTALALQKEVETLETELSQKNKEFNKYKNEQILLEEQMAICHEENKKLKVLIEMKEKEVKQAVDEKQVALDELLKQNVKPSKRAPKRYPRSMLDSPAIPSDKDDLDYVTPSKMKKTPAVASSLRRSSRRRVARNETMNSEVEQSVAGDDVSCDDELSIIAEGSMVSSVSIALSPFKPEANSEEEEDDVIDEIVKCNIVGKFIALKNENLDNIESPVIGKVIGINGDRIVVERWQGGYTKVWKVCGGGGNPNHEEIHLNQILYDDVRFTKFKRITVETKRKLQELYEISSLNVTKKKGRKKLMAKDNKMFVDSPLICVHGEDESCQLEKPDDIFKRVHGMNLRR